MGDTSPRRIVVRNISGIRLYSCIPNATIFSFNCCRACCAAGRCDASSTPARMSWFTASSVSPPVGVPKGEGTCEEPNERKEAKGSLPPLRVVLKNCNARLRAGSHFDPVPREPARDSDVRWNMGTARMLSAPRRPSRVCQPTRGGVGGYSSRGG